MTAAEFIAQWEGFRSDAYPDPGTGGEPWTIGFGSTRHPGSGLPIMPGTSITREKALEYLAHDVASAEAAVARLVKVPLTEGQRVAVTSLVYNVGEGAFARSTLLRMLNAGDYQKASEEFPKWNRAAGRVLPGLVRRRAAERAMFAANQHSPSAAATSAAPTLQSHSEASMDPFTLAAATSLIQYVPALIRAFGGKGERTEQNAKTAEQVVEIAKQITGAQTAEGAVQAVAGDPAKQAELREAVHANLADVLDSIERIATLDQKSVDSARAYNGAPSFESPVFVVTCIVLVMVAAGLGFVLVTSKDVQMQTTIVQALIAMGVGAVGYWVGSSHGSMIKTVQGQTRQ